MSVSLEAIWDRCRQRYQAATPRQQHRVGLLAVYVIAYLLVDAHAYTRSYLLTPQNNLNVAEAEAWLAGRLDLGGGSELGQRPWDSAAFDGRVFNIFPPLFTLIAVPILKLVPEGVPNEFLIVLGAMPLPALAYAVFVRRTHRVSMAVLLSVGYLLGTSLLPVWNSGLRNGDVWRVNHLLSQVGVLIFLVDYFGRRRIWLGGLGLIVAAWSRQVTGLYVVPLAYAAVVGRSGTRRRWRLAILGLMTAVMAALPATLNTLKFGSPLASGYRHIYEGRWNKADDPPAQAARRGIFSPVFIPRNLYCMNLGFPYPDDPLWMLRFVPSSECTGIWWTTPVLLLLLADWRKLWAVRDHRWLLAAAGLIFAVLMAYHTTGRTQFGYNRFSLDFMPVLLAVVAPACDAPRRRWLTFGLVLWSVWYFRWAI